MRLRILASWLVLFGLVVPLFAQAQQVELATPEIIAAALARQGVLFLRDKDIYQFKLGSQSVTLRRFDDGNRLEIEATIKRAAPLAAFNLKTGLDCKAGTTAANVHKFIAGFQANLAALSGAPVTLPPVNAIPSTPAVGKRKVPLDIKPGSDDKEFVIHFPTSVPRENAETAWKIIWDMQTGQQASDQGYKSIKRDKFGNIKEMPGFGSGRNGAVMLFKIKKAYYQPGKNAPWIQVLEDAHPQEFYVPYYFVNTRFFDLRDVGGYVSLSANEGGAVSQVLSKSRRVMAELRDRGVAYKHGSIMRRGEEFTLWANFAAGNYTYMVEFGFHDDGTIVFRHAPTGWNYYSHFNASHMHGSYWRIGIKLGPEGQSDKNQVHVVRLPKSPKEQGDKKGTLGFEEITRETFVDWKPEEFTRIRVTNPEYAIVPPAKDRPPLPIAYDLVSIVQGLAKHERFKDERFTLHPFWITRHDCPEKMYVNLGNYLLDGAGKTNPKVLPLDGQNVTIWHSSAGLHTPRAEDGIIGGAGLNNGQATIYWTSFELRPRNLFLKTPLYRVGE